jgi:hypothetical protein
MGYPVVIERALPPVRRRLFIGASRDQSDLPERPPGGVYLFRVNGRFQQYGDDQHIDLGDRTVVDATSVSVVQIRPWSVTADVPIDSKRASDKFTVRTEFLSRVTRPELVAEAGHTNLGAVLANHLRQDRDLSGLGLDYRIEDINELRKRIEAQITAYCLLSPINVRGMEIDLLSVDVLSSKDFIDHSRRIRDGEWDEEVERRRRRFEDENVERLAATFERGPVHADALGVARGEINISDVAIRAHEADQERRKQMAGVMQNMVERGFFDRVPLDPIAIMNAVTGTSGTPQPISALAPAQQPPAVTGPTRHRKDSDDEPDFIPDEETDE